MTGYRRAREPSVGLHEEGEMGVQYSLLLIDGVLQVVRVHRDSSTDEVEEE